MQDSFSIRGRSASIRRTGTVKHSSQRKGSVESWGELMAAEKAHDKGIELNDLSDEDPGSRSVRKMPALSTGLVRRRSVRERPKPSAQDTHAAAAKLYDKSYEPRNSGMGPNFHSATESGVGKEWIELQEEKQRRIHRERKLEVDIVKILHLPKMDYFSQCDCLVKATYGNTTFKTRVVRGTLNPEFEHTFFFKYRPEISEIFLEAVYYSGKGESKGSTIGVAEILVESDILQNDTEIEVDVNIKDLDGHDVRGESSQPTTVCIRQRLAERTFNVTLPPYKFKAIARFIDQKDVFDDGPTPKQFAHNRLWRVPTLKESIEASWGKGMVFDLMKAEMEKNSIVRKTFKDEGQQRLKRTMQERLQNAVDSLEVQIFLMAVVFVDLITVFLFQFGDFVIAKEDTDCFERDLPPLLAITVAVMGIYIIEILLRMLGHGKRFFQNFWNLIDLLFVVFSLVPAFVKVVSDFQYPTDGLCSNRSDVPQTFAGREVVFPAACEYPTILRFDSGLCQFLYANQDSGPAASVAGLEAASASARVISRVAIAARFIRAFVGMNRARRLRGSVVAKMQDITRQAVGGTKRRYTRDGFDLDLTYVTDRCIAMSTPGFGGHKNYRNDIHIVARYLNLTHYGKYRVYNLCEEYEGNYHPALLYYQMRRFAFDDHNPPLMKQILMLCQNAIDFMSTDNRNVIAIHCKGGKGRTGVMALAWLLVSGHRSCVVDALELFAFRRTNKYKMGDHHNQTVEGPSQIRYCYYLEAALYSGENPVKEPQMLLVGVKFPSAPGKPGKKYFLSMVVVSRGATVYDSRFNMMALPHVESGTEFAFRVPTVVVRGDTKVEIYRHTSADPRSDRLGSSKYGSKKDVWPFCQVVFHTAFHEHETQMNFSKFQIDYSHKDRAHTSYPRDFALTLSFSRPTSREDRSGDVTALSVVALRGENLLNRSSIGHQHFHPIVEISLGDERRRSDQAGQTFDPEWNQEFQFLAEPKDLSLSVQLFDGSHKTVLAKGTLEISLAEVEAAQQDEAVAAQSFASIGKQRISREGALAREVRETLLSSHALEGAENVVSGEGVGGAGTTVSAAKGGAGAVHRRVHQRKVELRDGQGVAQGEVDFTWAVEVWSTPEEYWDMKRFFQLIRQHGTLRTVRSGEEIVAMGSRRTELFLVTKVEIKNQDAEEEPCVVSLLGEDEIFGYSALLAGLPLMQHVAHTDVELRVISMSNRKTGLVKRTPSNGVKRTASLGGASSAALGSELILSGVPEAELSFFYKALALHVSEHFLMLKSVTLRVSSRTVQSDNLEALRTEALKDTMRHLMIKHFDLPATDQCRFIAQMVSIDRPPRSSKNVRQKFNPNKHQRIKSTSRVIFMTSAFVLEPTLFGAEFIEATRDDCFEIGRIVRVWVPGKERGCMQICVSVLEPWAYYDASVLALGRHNIQTIRFTFPTEDIFAKSLGLLMAMGFEAARRRSLQRGMQSSQFNNDIPHLEPVLEFAASQGGSRSFAPGQMIVGMNSDAHGNLYHVCRGNAHVLSEDVPPRVLWTVATGQLYGENQFLSGAHAGFFTVRAGDHGCEVVVIEREQLIEALAAQPGDQERVVREFFRALAIKLAHRNHEESITAYGSEWIHDVQP